MAEVVTTKLVCDLHKPGTNKMATTTRTVDVCTLHAKMIDEHRGPGETFTCPECGRKFRKSAGLRKHQTDTHGYAPATEAAAIKRKQKSRSKKSHLKAAKRPMRKPVKKRVVG